MAKKTTRTKVSDREAKAVRLLFQQGRAQKATAERDRSRKRRRDSEVHKKGKKLWRDKQHR